MEQVKQMIGLMTKDGVIIYCSMSKFDEIGDLTGFGIKFVANHRAKRIQQAWRKHNEFMKKTPDALKIQKAWRECISNPSYLMCRQRLLKEFAEL